MHVRTTHWFKALFILTSLVASFSASSQHPALMPEAAPVRITVPYTALAKGFVSLAIYDKSGALVRSLLYAQPVEKGPHKAVWDGTTDLGKPAVAGAYEAKGIFFDRSPQMKFVMEVGKNGNPPWRTPDGKGDWGGNLGFPSSIISNSKSLFMTYAAVEDNQITGIQQMDATGSIQRRYFSFYGWDTRMAAAADDEDYYLGIINTERNRIEIAHYRVGEPRGKILTVIPTRFHADQHDNRFHGKFTAWLDGLAITGDTLYATVSADNSIYLIDRATGEIKLYGSIPEPRGIAVDNSGADPNRLVAISGRTVVRLNKNGIIESVLVPDGVLTAPSALAVDRDGNIYVGDGGEVGIYGPTAYGKSGTRQIYVFRPDGKLLLKIGKPGGSPQEGRFDENGLGVIISICMAPDGNSIWVNDIATGFHRTSQWSLNGKLMHQWFGRKLSLFSDVINSSRPNELIHTNDAFADEPGITAYEMDLDKKTWRPSWHYDTTWKDMFQEDVYLSFEHSNPLDSVHKYWPVFYYDSRNFVTYKGRNYFMDVGGNGDGAIFLYSPDHKPQPVALVCNHRCDKLPDGRIQGYYDQGPNNWFTWADRNGDGKMASDEILYAANPQKLAQTRRLNEARLDDHLNVIMKRWVRTDGGDVLIDSMLPLKELLPNGAPVYDWADLRDLVPLQAPDLTGGDNVKKVAYYGMPMPVDTSDAFYSMVEPDPQGSMALPGVDGDGWWASRNWRTKVARFDKKTGKCLWAVGRRAPGKAEPGQMYHPTWLAGVAANAVFVTDTLGPIWVWSTDGLYLGNMANDFGSGIEDDKTLYGEIQATLIYTDSKTGKIYSIANDEGAHIHEVSLPVTTRLTTASVTLSTAEASAARPWDPDGRPPTEHPAYIAKFISHPINIHGDQGDLYLGEHNGSANKTLILMDGRELAQFSAVYDTANLYLCYQVKAPFGFINSGSELPLAPFVSGAYVDFSIGPNWQGPREKVREGDMRVVVARVKAGAGDELFQQGFWQVKQDGINGRTIKSPAATVHFDQIEPVPGLLIAYTPHEKDPKSGAVTYSVEMAVPLAALGLISPAGRTIGFDASVGISNASGDRRERAAHWGGLSEAVVVDRPGSTRLLPSTWGTLTFEASK